MRCQFLVHRKALKFGRFLNQAAITCRLQKPHLVSKVRRKTVKNNVHLIVAHWQTFHEMVTFHCRVLPTPEQKI